MTPKYSWPSSSDNLLDASALDLIRQLDQSLAEANQGIVEAFREAESATQNARLAAEIRRRFSKPTGASPAISSPQSSYPVTTPRSPPFVSSSSYYNESESKVSEQGTTTSPPTTRLAVAHAEELVDLSFHLEHVKRQLEDEMMDHQDTKAKLTCAETTIERLKDQLEQSQNQIEALKISHESSLAETSAELQAAQETARIESEDAEYAMELAKQKIAEEQEMRNLLQQVLEKNEEYRQYIAEQSNAKKMVSFRDPVDDLSQQNHRLLVAKGRELLQRQKGDESSPSKQVTHAISTCQATAAILKQSGRNLGCWEDAEVSISDEVQLERLARNYVQAVELQMTQQRQSIQELESFCALLEQSET